MKWNRMQRMLLLFALLCLVVVMCNGQQSADSRTSQSALLGALLSDNWMDRARAYEQLRSDPIALRQPKVQTALLNLLDRENHVVEAALRESHEQVGASGKYGEEYGEYVSELGESVDTFANWNDPRQVCIFVRESYNPSSRFAAKIASHAKISAPCLIEMYGSDLDILRGNAAAVLVQTLANPQKSIDSETSTQIRQLLMRALHDPEDGVRSETVNALGKFGEQDMLSALRQVAETDPAPEVQGHSVRKQAAKAIAAIEKRAAQDRK